MNYLSFRDDFALKTFGVKNTSNLTTAQTDAYINKGYVDFYRFLCENDDVGRAYFSTYDTSVTCANELFTLPATVSRILQITDSTKTNIYKQKTQIDRSWTPVTSGSIYITFIKTPEVIGDGTGGTVQTPALMSTYHDIVTDYSAFEYFNDLGGAYVADAKKWAQIAGGKAMAARKQLYWDVMELGNRNSLIDPTPDLGYYFVNYGYSSTQRLLKLFVA